MAAAAVGIAASFEFKHSNINIEGIGNNVEAFKLVNNKNVF